MWLFTPEGFYSIVTADEFGHEIQARSRSKADLDRLRKSYLPSLTPSKHISGRDYPWRGFTTRQELADCLAKVALALDYDNFKSAVAHRQGYERAHIYGRVWSACLAIEEEPQYELSPHSTTEGFKDHTADYRSRDLYTESTWNKSTKPRYGGVVFDHDGKVLLREPANHFDGYVWTFPKGAGHGKEHPADTALREVLEETGCSPIIIGHLAEGFTGTGTGSTNFYYLMFLSTTNFDESVMKHDGETASVRWASHEEAKGLISLSTNVGGRQRDLATLDSAFKWYARNFHEPT